MEVRTSEVNGVPVDAWADTLSALEHVVVNGYVADEAGNLMTNFNGFVYPTVFDQRSEVTTLNNDGGTGGVSYGEWRNRIHTGAVRAEQGTFSFEFIVPRDIGYEPAPGRISYYAVDGDLDAHGYTEQVFVGGVSEDAVLDDEGPEIELFLNDTNFVNGGTTDPHPILYARLRDDQGLNTVGNGIGHDLKATLDGSTSVVLNEFYASDLNTYQSGRVVYPFSDLEEGPHTLELKAWDVHNNSAKATLDFVVVSDLEVFLDGLISYPNPMDRRGTTFRFDHNQACVALTMSLSVYDSMGNVVWEGEREETPPGIPSGRMALGWNKRSGQRASRRRLPLPPEPHDSRRPTGHPNRSPRPARLTRLNRTIRLNSALLMASRIFLLRALGILAAVGILAPSAHAQLTQVETAQQLQLNTITTAVPFLTIAPDSRSGALGDAGVALTPDGAAMAWNPARMAFTDQTFESHLGMRHGCALVDDMSLAYLSGTRKLNKRQAIGMALRYFSSATSRSPTSTARPSGTSAPMSSPSTSGSPRSLETSSAAASLRVTSTATSPGGPTFSGRTAVQDVPWLWTSGSSTPTTTSSSETATAG